QGERSIWRPAGFGLVLASPTWTDVPDDYSSSFTMQVHGGREIEVIPAQAVSNDLAYGFSEVIVRLYSPSGSFSAPHLSFYGGLTGTNFLGQPTDYYVNNGFAYGTPYYYETNHGLIRVLLPEGTFTLYPSITVAGGNVGLASIPLTVAAGQRVDV